MSALRMVPWHDVPQPVRRVGFSVAAAAAFVVIVGLAALLVVAVVLHTAQAGGL